MTKPLLTEVEDFISAHNMPPVTFGRAAMRDPHFVRDLRAGRRVWPETEQKVRTFMAEYRPTSEDADREIAA